MDYHLTLDPIQTQPKKIKRNTLRGAMLVQRRWENERESQDGDGDGGERLKFRWIEGWLRINEDGDFKSDQVKGPFHFSVQFNSIVPKPL